MSERIDNNVLETTFHCKICNNSIKFHIADNTSYVSKTEQKQYFGMQLVTYRVFHDTETERHHNTVLVDHKGFFRGYVDFYKEKLYRGSIEADVKEKSEFRVISDENKMDRTHSLIDTFLFFDLEERWILPVIHPLPLKPLEFIEVIEKKITEAKAIYTDLPDDLTFDITGKSYKLVLLGYQAIVFALKDQSASHSIEKLTERILELNFGYKRGLPKLTPFFFVLGMLETDSEELNQETALRILTDDLLHAPIEVSGKEHLSAIIEELKPEFNLPEEVFVSLLSGQSTVLDLLSNGNVKDIQELLSLVDFGKKLSEVMINGMLFKSSEVNSIVREILIRHKVISELNKGVDLKEIASKIFDMEFKRKDPEFTLRTVRELEKILSLDNYTDRMKKSLEELIKHLQDKPSKEQKKKRRFF